MRVEVGELWKSADDCPFMVVGLRKLEVEGEPGGGFQVARVLDQDGIDEITVDWILGYCTRIA